MFQKINSWHINIIGGELLMTTLEKEIALAINESKKYKKFAKLQAEWLKLVEVELECYEHLDFTNGKVIRQQLVMVDYEINDNEKIYNMLKEDIESIIVKDSWIIWEKIKRIFQ